MHVVWALGLCTTLATTSPSAIDVRSALKGRQLAGNTSAHVDVTIARAIIEHADRLEIYITFFSRTGVDASVRVRPDSTLPPFEEETKVVLQRAGERDPGATMLRVTESSYALVFRREGCDDDAGVVGSFTRPAVTEPSFVACFDFESFDELCPGDDGCHLGFLLERSDHGDPWPEPTGANATVTAERDTYQAGCVGRAEDEREPFPGGADVEVEVEDG